MIAAANPLPGLLFATETYVPMAEALRQLVGLEPGAIDRKTFPDGERYRRLESDVAGRDVIVLGGTISDEATLELYDLACAAAKYGAKRLTLLIPYFGYATMERAVKPGEVVTAKTRARLLSTVPVAAEPMRVVMVDLHSEGIPHYFEGPVRPVHLYAKPLVAAMVKALAGTEQDFVLASTDAGRAKWVESLANDLGVPAAFVLKRRLSGEQTEVMAMNAQVEGRHVIVYDDMIRTGGSLIEAAKAYRQAGATKVSAVATHGLFPGDSLAKLQASGAFTRLATTDSHPAALRGASPFLAIEPLAPLLAQWLRAHP
jgi:ribose-phosphate pyrophosphokinase